MRRIKLSMLDSKILKRFNRNIPFPIFFGGDPEFFVADKRGKILNSDQFFPHKTKPYTINLNYGSGKGKLYFDGIQAEFGMSPAICRVYFIMAVKQILSAAKNKIGEHKIVLKPSVRIRKDILVNAHPDAKIFGCMPDYNAYTLSVNTPEMNAERHPYRYAGGHIHIGLIKSGHSRPQYKRQRELLENETEHINWIKSLDFFVNLLTLPLDNSPASKRRRSKYGKAGCFRPTPYGIEYRSLSCWWLKSPIFVSLVLGLAKLGTAVAYSNNYKKLLEMLNIEEEDVRRAIDESDVKYAKRVWRSSRALFSGIRPRISILHSKYSEIVNVNIKNVVYLQPLTLLDYLITRGPDGLIDTNNVVNEWQLENEETYQYRWGDNNSFINGLRNRISSVLGINRAIRYEKSLAKAIK